MTQLISSYKLAVIFIFTLAIFISCESPIGFTKPQPEGSADLAAFPNEFRGIYFCSTDSILIKIKERSIYSEFTEIALIPTEYIESREDCKIVNDSLYMEGQKECIKIEQIKNGIISAVKVTKDTLFRLTPFQKARMHKGNLVLSQITENDLWTIALLELDGKNGIIYKSITDESNLQNIEAITQVTKVGPESTRYPNFKISPKKVELEDLFKDPEVFIDCNYYSRVNLAQ